jgi:hypothetical protein
MQQHWLPYELKEFWSLSPEEQRLLAGRSASNRLGTGSVSCNSVFVLHLCCFLNQEDLMEREAMVQNP